MGHRKKVIIRRWTNNPANFSTSSSPPPQPLVELREYQLVPELAGQYMSLTEQSASLRKSLVPFRLFTLPETGGKLNIATHMYYYDGGHSQRDKARASMGQTPDWVEYIKAARPGVLEQRSTIFVEAPVVVNIPGVRGLANASDLFPSGPSASTIYEFRRYRLKLGYDTVPKFLELYSTGLPSKLGAPNTCPSTSLVTLLYSEVGILNEVIEVWRHGDGTQAMERSRIAARAAPEWRYAISQIAGLAIEFSSSIHRPTSFSPLQ